MKIRPVLLACVASVLAAAALFGGGGKPAGAVVTSTASEVAPMTGGTVSGGSESVVFSGQAVIDSKMVPDPDFGSPPNVVLSIDMSPVTGIGQSTKTTYVTSARQIVIRPLAASDTVQFTFPFYPSGTNGVSSSRIGQVTFAMTFNVNAGTVISASATYSTP